MYVHGGSYTGVLFRGFYIRPPHSPFVCLNFTIFFRNKYLLIVLLGIVKYCFVTIFDCSIFYNKYFDNITKYGKFDSRDGIFITAHGCCMRYRVVIFIFYDSIRTYRKDMVPTRGLKYKRYKISFWYNVLIMIYVKSLNKLDHKTDCW